MYKQKISERNFSPNYRVDRNAFVLNIQVIAHCSKSIYINIRIKSGEILKKKILMYKRTLLQILHYVLKKKLPYFGEKVDSY